MPQAYPAFSAVPGSPKHKVRFLQRMKDELLRLRTQASRLSDSGSLEADS
ncbi:hypothetical protein ACVWZD_007144 [Streptomyces sp. TE3672]